MHFKNFIITLLFCGIFQYAVATGILLNALKNTVQNTRCKLHNIGSKIIQHDHNHGDPCDQPAFTHEDHGSSHENNNFGSSGYGNNNFGSSDYENNHFGTSGYANKNFGYSGYNKNNFGSSSYGNNKLESQNGYQVSENLDEDRSLSYGNQQVLLEKKPEHTFNGHSYGSLNEKDRNNFDVVPTTRRYQPTVNMDKNKISKDTSNNGFGNLDQETNNYNYGSYNVVENQTENNFGKSNINNLPVNNFLPEISREKYRSTSKPPSNDNETLENVIVDIFGKPNVETNIGNNIGNEGISGYSKKPEVNSENPVFFDIDVRGGGIKQSTTYASVPQSKTYASVPRDGGRNILKVSCPAGSRQTKDGECLYEFK